MGVGGSNQEAHRKPTIPVVQREVSASARFEGALEPYGSWETDATLGRVFIPSDPDYVPYDGEWNREGSQDRFATSDPTAWATCHYGAWHRRDRWMWQPSTTYRSGPGDDYDRVLGERQKLERHYDRLEASERARLIRQLDELRAEERARLEEHLARRGARADEIAAERARLARKQALRDARDFARLDRRQHAREVRGRDRLTWKQERPDLDPRWH